MASSTAVLGPEYSAFLYACVGEEANETPVSVLSTLARRNVDPWQEAKELAALPVDAATRRLTTALTGVSSISEIGTTVDRLLSLLPARTGATARVSEGAPFSLEQLRMPVILWTMTVGFILGLQVVAANRQQSPSIEAPPPTSSPATPQAARPGSGR